VAETLMRNAHNNITLTFRLSSNPFSKVKFASRLETLSRL
jgi:hypothetical protein